MSTHSPLRRLTDERLRAESSRRRLIATTCSVSGSMFCLGGATWLNQSGANGIALPVALALFVVNLGLLIFLFRWMSEPAKERARRRRLSVLKMLGVEESSKAESAPLDTSISAR